MIQPNDTGIQIGINYELLNDARIDKGLTFEKLADLSRTPEGSVKNMLTGRTKNPGSENLSKVCEVLEVPMELVLRQDVKKEIENQGIKKDDASILALKEIYELQISNIKETNEKHINNIRAHYEQHHQDLTENYERRLSDKKEINDTLKEQIKDLRTANFIKTLIISGFVLIFIVLFIMELMHPQHGWLRY